MRLLVAPKAFRVLHGARPQLRSRSVPMRLSVHQGADVLFDGRGQHGRAQQGDGVGKVLPLSTVAAHFQVQEDARLMVCSHGSHHVLIEELEAALAEEASGLSGDNVRHARRVDVWAMCRRPDGARWGLGIRADRVARPTAAPHAAICGVRREVPVCDANGLACMCVCEPRSPLPVQRHSHCPFNRSTYMSPSEILVTALAASLSMVFASASWMEVNAGGPHLGLRYYSNNY